MSALPAQWSMSSFGNIAEIQLGKMLDKAKNRGTPTPYLRNVNVRWGYVDTSDISMMSMTEEERSKYAIENGDLLVCEGGEPGRAAVWRSGPTPLKFQKAILRVRGGAAVSPDWLMHYLRSAARDGSLSQRFSGTTIKHLPREALQATSLPLAPIEEQRRIVAKIDSLSVKSKRARDHLDHLPRLAAKFKDIILDAAFSGRLTSNCRKSHISTAEAHERLSRIREERDRLNGGTVRAYSRHSEVGGNGRVRLDLGLLPNTWATSTLHEVSSPVRLIQYGILMPGDDIPGGIPYVKVMNIKGGKIELKSIRRTSVEIHQKFQRSSIKTYDILLTIRGTVGRTAFVPPELDGGNITQDSVRIDVAGLIDRRFIFWFLQSPAARAYFAANTKGVAVRGVNVGDIRLMEVPVPAEYEQVEIVRRIEGAFAWIDRLTTEATCARKLVDHLDRAILSKAFRGELVPQDPNDEPASVLLERIRAEKVGTSQPRKGRGRPKMVRA